nr:xyloglucan endotransglycosylase [Tanacetum cinerariifolium]
MCSRIMFLTILQTVEVQQPNAHEDLVLKSIITMLSAAAKPATFLQDFRVTWSDSHIKQLDGEKGFQLLEQNS